MFRALALHQRKYAGIRSDEGLTLETSAHSIYHGGNSPFINSFDKTKISVREMVTLRL